MTHTPGPWNVADGNCVDSEEFRIGLAVGGCGAYRANAQLMAAAPELLEALQLLLEDYLQISAMYQTNPDNGEWYEPQLVGVARAAIAKATGA